MLTEDYTGPESLQKKITKLKGKMDAEYKSGRIWEAAIFQHPGNHLIDERKTPYNHNK